MLKGVFPALYQPDTVTMAFFKSLPMAVLPITTISAGHTVRRGLTD
jgi:hypothetical protein